MIYALVLLLGMVIGGLAVYAYEEYQLRKETNKLGEFEMHDTYRDEVPANTSEECDSPEKQSFYETGYQGRHRAG